jgi:hypothetical protein
LFNFVGQDDGHDDPVNRSCLTENNANMQERNKNVRSVNQSNQLIDTLLHITRFPPRPQSTVKLIPIPWLFFSLQAETTVFFFFLT